MKKILSLLAVILFAAIGAYSQAPGIFNYQGVARNSVGNVLINQAIALRLTIHDGTAAGPVVYQEVRGTITNPFGLFNVQVGSPGFTSQTGTVAGVPWAVGNKYIQVEIDPNGGSAFINIGTAQIASVPYALYSSLAGDLVLPFNKTQADAGTLFRINNSGTGISGAIMGTTLSPAANAWGVHGQVNNTSAGGFSTGVLGTNLSTTGLGIGVTGTQNGGGWGVYGTAPSGIGVNGASTSGFGVNGSSVSGTGGFFSTTSGIALNSAGALRHTGIGEGAPIAPNLFKILAGDPVGNATWQHASAIGLVSGSGTLNFVPKWTPNGTTLGNSQIFDDGTSVGIGTIVPANKLEVLQTGINSAGLFTVNNAANSSNTLVATTNGTGNAVLGQHTAATGLSAGVRGESNSQDANAVAVQGVIISTTPGGFSAAVRGTNNGTGGLGIGVVGTQAGSGWGVYGTTPSGIGVYGLSTSGFGVYGQSTSGVSIYGIQPSNGTNSAGYFQNTNIANGSPTLYATTNGTGEAMQAITSGTGNAGIFSINNGANTSNALNALTIGTGRAILGRRGIGSGIALGQTEAIRGDNTDGPGVAGTANTAVGVYGTSITTHGIWGVAVVANAAGVEGRNDVVNGFGVEGVSLGGGIGVHGSSQTGLAGQFDVTNAASTGDAIKANQNGLGRGLYALINNSSNIVGAVRGETNGGGYGIFGQATGNGNAGFFQVSNPASTSSTVNVTANGIGSGITVQLTNASNGARGIDILQAGVGPAGFATSAGGMGWWGITSSISAAGILGDNTFGEAVVGRNRGGLGVGAVVGRNDSSGYGTRGFNTKDGIGALGQAGISGGTGIGGVFENVNAANPNYALVARTNGTGAAFLANNSNGAVTDIAIFQKGGVNMARIDGTGKGFFNNGTQVGGADVAEYFDIEGLRSWYEPGDVLVVSRTSDRKVEKSSSAYSSLVSGVYATRPGVSLTERNAEADQLKDMVPMGIIGVIPTKVCIEGGAIKRGDLLVTSSIPGVAMKADPDKVKVGQVLGKALQDYNANEVGKINVLVSVK